MVTTTARNPFTIFQRTMKSNLNDVSNYILYRALVYEVDTKGGLFNNGMSPIGALKVKIYKPQINMNDSGFTIVWPINDYDTPPVAPMESVSVIYEKDSLDYGFWYSRWPNIDKSYVDAGQDLTQNTSDNSAAEAFGVESQSNTLSINDIVASQEDLQSIIDEFKPKLQKRINFEKRIQDHLISSKNTGRIVLGNDRRDTTDSGYEDGEAIDIVVGVQKENGDPDFENDKSRIYISSKSNMINGLGNQEEEALWYIKSDNNALIARKNILVESKDGGVKIKFNKEGNIEIEGNQKVTIRANNVVIDGTTVIGGPSGTNKILTTIGPDIPSLLEQIAIFLDAVTFADFTPLPGAPPVSKAALSNASAKLHEVAAAMQVATKSNAV